MIDKRLDSIEIVQGILLRHVGLLPTKPDSATMAADGSITLSDGTRHYPYGKVLPPGYVEPTYGTPGETDPSWNDPRQYVTTTKPPTIREEFVMGAQFRRKGVLRDGMHVSGYSGDQTVCCEDYIEGGESMEPRFMQWQQDQIETF